MGSKTEFLIGNVILIDLDRLPGVWTFMYYADESSSWLIITRSNLLPFTGKGSLFENWHCPIRITPSFIIAVTTIRTKQLLLLLEHLEHNPSDTLPRLVVLRSLGDKGMFSESILVGTDIGMPIKVPIGQLGLYVKHYIARLIRRKQLS